MRILGIDHGLSTTGYGLIESNGHAPKLLEAGVLHSAAGLPLEKRLLELYRGISEIIGGFSPASMAVEALFSHYSHPRPALQMAHARGLVDSGAAVLIPEKLLDPATLSAQLGAILASPDAAVAMAQHALGQGRPDATERLVALVEDLAKGIST